MEMSAPRDMRSSQERIHEEDETYPKEVLLAQLPSEPEKNTEIQMDQNHPVMYTTMEKGDEESREATLIDSRSDENSETILNEDSGEVSSNQPRKRKDSSCGTTRDPVGKSMPNSDQKTNGRSLSHQAKEQAQRKKAPRDDVEPSCSTTEQVVRETEESDEEIRIASPNKDCLEPDENTRKEPMAITLLHTKLTPTLQFMDNDMVKLSWEHAPYPPNHYEIEWSSNGKYTIGKTKGDKYVINTSTSKGCKYVVSITPVTGENRGLPSEPLEFFAAPMDPANVRVHNSPLAPESSIVVNFSDPDSYHKSFKVVINTANTEVQSHVTESPYYTFCNLEPGTSYRIYVQSQIRNAHKGPEFLLSKKAYAEGDIMTVPASAKDLKWHNESGDPKFLWDAIPGASAYIVKWRCENREFEATTRRPQITLSSLELDKIFTITVAAENPSGRGLFCDHLTFTTAPQAPENVNVSHVRSSSHTTFMVTFEDNNKEGKSYTVAVEGLTGQSKRHDADVGNNCSALVSGLVPGETYRVYVIAEWHNQVSTKSFHPHPIQTYPATPDDLKVKIVDNALHVAWNAVAIPPNHYRVEIDTNGETRATEQTIHTHFRKLNLRPSCVYRVSVAAVNDAGCGNFCEPKEAATDPVAPAKISVTRNEESPDTSLIVSIYDPDKTKKLYRVTLQPPTGEEIVRETTQKSAIIKNLTPGQRYIVFAVAVVRVSNKFLESDRVYYV